MGRTQLQAKEGQGLPGATGSREVAKQDSSQSLWGAVALIASYFGLPASGTLREESPDGLCHQICSTVSAA